MPVISVRVSEEWLQELDEECTRRIWKRNAAIVNLVWIALSGRGVDVEQDGTRSIETERNRSNGVVVKSAPKQVSRPAASTKLSGPVAQLAEQRPHKPHDVGSSPAGSTNNCLSCGGMNGMHQRGCKFGQKSNGVK